MSFDERLRNYDKKKKDLSSWEAELKEQQASLNQSIKQFALEQENKDLLMQLKATEISSKAHQLLYKIKSEFKDSILEQLKSLYESNLRHNQFMHEKAIILKDIEIAFFEYSN